MNKKLEQEAKEFLETKVTLSSEDRQDFRECLRICVEYNKSVSGYFTWSELILMAKDLVKLEKELMP